MEKIGKFVWRRNSAENAEANRSKARKNPVFSGLLDAERACAPAEKVLSDRFSFDVQKLGFETRGEPDMGKKAWHAVWLGRKRYNRNDLFPESDSVNTVRGKRDPIPNIHLCQIPISALPDMCSIFDRSGICSQPRARESDTSEFSLKKKFLSTGNLEISPEIEVEVDRVR